MGKSNDTDPIGPLGPYPPSDRIALPRDTRREVIIVGNRVKEVGERAKIVAEWSYKKLGME